MRGEAMAAASVQPFGDIGRWQAALEPHAETFSCLSPGARIGVVQDEAVCKADRAGAEMLVWQANERGLRVRSEFFSGFEQTDVDILMAADEVALASLREALDGDLLASMRRLIRDGHILFFARKGMRDLEDAGYEDLLGQLGFAFLGACR